MSQITEAQHAILSTAAQRDDGAVHPLPSELAIRGGAVAATLNSLRKKGLIAAPPQGDGDLLVITAAGCQAVGIDAEPECMDADEDRPALATNDPKCDTTDGQGETVPEAASASSMAAPAGSSLKAASGPAAPAAKPGTKLALLIDLLARETGATIAEAVDATGWQAHSVRGAISGTVKKKLGLAVSSENIEGRGRVYRIAPEG